jgi:hypothetical protein
MFVKVSFEVNVERCSRRFVALSREMMKRGMSAVVVAEGQVLGSCSFSRVRLAISNGVRYRRMVFL